MNRGSNKKWQLPINSLWERFIRRLMRIWTIIVELEGLKQVIDSSLNKVD